MTFSGSIVLLYALLHKLFSGQVREYAARFLWRVI